MARVPGWRDHAETLDQVGHYRAGGGLAAGATSGIQGLADCIAACTLNLFIKDGIKINSVKLRRR